MMWLARSSEILSNEMKGNENDERREHDGFEYKRMKNNKRDHVHVALASYIIFGSFWYRTILYDIVHHVLDDSQRAIRENWCALLLSYSHSLSHVLALVLISLPFKVHARAITNGKPYEYALCKHCSVYVMILCACVIHLICWMCICINVQKGKSVSV